MSATDPPAQLDAPLEPAGELAVQVGYLGPEGTYSHQAALAYVESRAVRLVPMPSIPDLLTAVDRGDLDLAVVPLENALEGSVTVAFDMLVHEVDLWIQCELVLPIHHVLVALEGTALSEVETVYSHPQALAQCRRRLRALLPHAKTIAVSSTAEGARLVAQSGRESGRENGRESGRGTSAALCSPLAARRYGLAVLAEALEDAEGNATRFGVLRPRTAADTRRAGNPSLPLKTSFAFAFATDRPGALYEALGEFARRRINLSRIESRPARRSLGEYIFLADLDGSLEDPIVQEALAGLRQRCAFVRVLGSFPVRRL